MLLFYFTNYKGELRMTKKLKDGEVVYDPKTGNFISNDPLFGKKVAYHNYLTDKYFKGQSPMLVNETNPSKGKKLALLIAKDMKAKFGN